MFRGFFRPEGGVAMLEGLSRLLWGWHVVVLILGAGAWFTWESGFFQIRAAGRWLGAALSCAGEGKKAGGLSRLQALATGLAGSLGTGNIVGVGVALAAGGPGALFWMALSALLGMMTVFGENVLAARYRGKPGPLGYLERAWGRPLAWVYALGCCLSALVMGNMVQTGAAAAALSLFQVPPWAAGAVLGLLAFLGAWGGLGKGARALEKLVPLMTLLFFAGTLALLWRCRARIPAAFVQIFQGAFSLEAGAGGAAGMLLAVQAGVTRGVFTNEAGLGSASFAYGAVGGRSPGELGCLGIFQVFLDTLVMCTLTGLCVVCCAPQGDPGQLVFLAFRQGLGSGGARLLGLCTALFALATVTAWSCYGKEALGYLTGGRGGRLYAAGAGACAFLGCVLPLSQIFLLGDAMNGLMALPNLFALFLLSREVREEVQALGRPFPHSPGSLHNFLKKV